LHVCNIISKEDFCSESVSQEHIDECIWIAEEMLRLKPLEVWVALAPQQGQQSFKNTVAAINLAREHARMNAETVPVQTLPPQMDEDSPRFSPRDSVSLGSSVSFGAEDVGQLSGLPSIPPSAPSMPTILSIDSVFVGSVPPTIPSVPGQGQTYTKSPIPSVNCYHQQAEVSSNMPSASSLGDEGGGGFASVLTPSSGQPISHGGHQSPLSPPPTLPGPPRRFSFRAQEVMAAPPPRHITENRAPSPGYGGASPMQTVDLSRLPASVGSRLNFAPAPEFTPEDYYPDSGKQ